MDIIITIIVVLGILSYLYISKTNCLSPNSNYQIYINLILWLIPSIGLYFIIRPLTLYKVNVNIKKDNTSN